MSTITGIISSAVLQGQTATSGLTGAQQKALDDILKHYTPDNFSQKDFANLSADLKKAGIPATAEVKSAIEAQGFNIDQYINQTDAASSSDAFGPAVTLDLSKPAQGVVSDTTPATSTASATSDTAPVATTVSYNSVSSAVTKAKREVSPQIGVGGADEVVDARGNINYSKLNQLLDLQAAKKAS